MITPTFSTRDLLDEQGGYDGMYAGVRIEGVCLLHGNAYGQESCEPLAPEARVRMETNANLITAAPALLAAAELALRDAVADEMDPWFAALKAAVGAAKNLA